MYSTDLSCSFPHKFLSLSRTNDKCAMTVEGTLAISRERKERMLFVTVGEVEEDLGRMCRGGVCNWRGTQNP